MLRSNWIKGLAVTVVAAVALIGCKKQNGIDNNAIVRTPYSLYYTDTAGTISHTNTGDSFKLVWASDGYAERSIITSGENIIMVKHNTHLSSNEGENFNPVDSSVIQTVGWQSIMLDVPSHGRVYLASTKGFGIIYSQNHGLTWTVDNNFDTAVTNHTTPAAHSFAQLTNGELYAYNDRDTQLYKRINTTAQWTKVVMNSLPPTPSYFLSRFNNALIATDTTGVNGVWYSTDGGQNWAQYLGTQNYRLNATYAAFDQTLLVGTDSNGVYRLQNNFLNPSNNGLDPNTSVYGIAAKKDVYKNGQLKQYVYLASSTGLYRSEDVGLNWIKVLPGSFRRVY